LETVSISRLHDLAAFAAEELPAGLSAATSLGEIGQVVALAGVLPSGRIEVITGEVIARTSGIGYGIGRPDVYVIAATAKPGWSGGPVVDSNGDVIAIIVGVEQRTGVTLAVPIKYLPTP
ncbi:MAG: S1-C subfamily serine protease, partial [Verrucomicrobiales bacterium]